MSAAGRHTGGEERAGRLTLGGGGSHGGGLGEGSTSLVRHRTRKSAPDDSAEWPGTRGAGEEYGGPGLSGRD